MAVGCVSRKLVVAVKLLFFHKEMALLAYERNHAIPVHLYLIMGFLIVPLIFQQHLAMLSNTYTMKATK